MIPHVESFPGAIVRSRDDRRKSELEIIFQLKPHEAQNPRLFSFSLLFSFLSFFLPLFLDTIEIKANNSYYVATIQAITTTWKRHLTEDDHATYQITKSFFWQ
jgi:hypothetical protein